MNIPRAIGWYLGHLMITLPIAVIWAYATQPTWYTFLCIWLLYGLLAAVANACAARIEQWWRARKKATE